MDKAERKQKILAKALTLVSDENQRHRKALGEICLNYCHQIDTIDKVLK